MRRILLLSAFLTVIVGCSKAPNIVGTWTSGLGGAVTTYHFFKDGNFSMETLFDGYKAEAKGTYELSGNRLNLNPATSDVQGAGPRVEEIKGMLMQPSKVTITMQSPSTFRLGLEEPPLIVNRVAPDP